ncbi:MAG TPA: preprotein translocase subunit SecY [Candidatus Paceibacterota bacterium]|nr:preprotein translocase subunit SecY [Candidatus Paceibacterota bacterium]
MNINNIIKNLPEVEGPVEKKLSFSVKAKWTIIVLVLFFILANISLYGLSNNALARFDNLAVILGTDFGSIISLGIGPIVMASIILQLLVGAKILDIDLTKEEGKKFFQGLQKLFVFFFIIFEASIYVLMQGLQAAPGYTWVVILQLCLGGLAIVFMDEIVHKWGFGSGVSLFIAAGVSWRIFTALFQFIGPEGGIKASGKILVFITSIMNGDSTGAILALATVIITVLIFLGIVWMQSLKIEIPLSFDRIRGYAVKWPLAFFYTSVIPVILVSALAANLQLAAGLLEKWLGHATILGGFSGSQPISGFAYWIGSTDLLSAIITNSFTSKMILQLITHILFYMTFSVVFAIFWVKTSGMDSQSQAKNILSSGLTIPGFRKDQRILESVLERYIFPLTIMGSATIGFIAAITNAVGAIVGGTSILLVIMIMYQFYQSIAKQHSVDMHPALRKIIKE